MELSSLRFSPKRHVAVLLDRSKNTKDSYQATRLNLPKLLAHMRLNHMIDKKTYLVNSWVNGVGIECEWAWLMMSNGNIKSRFAIDYMVERAGYLIPHDDLVISKVPLDRAWFDRSSIADAGADPSGSMGNVTRTISGSKKLKVGSIRSDLQHTKLLKFGMVSQLTLRRLFLKCEPHFVLNVFTGDNESIYMVDNMLEVAPDECRSMVTFCTVLGLYLRHGDQLWEDEETRINASYPILKDVIMWWLRREYDLRGLGVTAGLECCLNFRQDSMLLSDDFSYSMGSVYLINRTANRSVLESESSFQGLVNKVDNYRCFVSMEHRAFRVGLECKLMPTNFRQPIFRPIFVWKVGEKRRFICWN